MLPIVRIGGGRVGYDISLVSECNVERRFSGLPSVEWGRDGDAAPPGCVVVGVFLAEWLGCGGSVCL